ncbi:pyridoxal-phosphate dependent enzyme [bacterium]|nr:pyridoxal-phosphate dependent enzyme [bacterium]
MLKINLPPTPLIPIQLEPGSPTIWAKLEFLNPSGSAKDRIARHILMKAYRQGRLEPGDWVVEASSGSTAIALAMACAGMNLRFLAVLPEGASQERLLTIRAYGGEILTLPREAGMGAAVARAEEEARQRGGFATRQFENPDNCEAHQIFTAAEVLTQIPDGKVDAIVSGVGTGGTLVGLWQGCRQQNPACQPWACRPVTLSRELEIECCSFSARIPGVLDGFSSLYQPHKLPGLHQLEIEDRLALGTARRLIRRGFPVGPSSGLNFAAALLAAAELGDKAQIVTVFPDRMERYFSTELFNLEGDLAVAGSAPAGR